MKTFLAAVRLDPQARTFVIRAPDFPEIEEQCRDFNRALTMADEVVRECVRDRLQREGSTGTPVRGAELEGRAEYRQCVLVPVEVEEPQDR